MQCRFRRDFDLIGSAASPRARAFTAAYPHAQENKYTFIETVIPCLGRVSLRSSALQASIQHEPESRDPKPSFSVRLDSPADWNSDIRTALPSEIASGLARSILREAMRWRRGKRSRVSSHNTHGISFSHSYPQIMTTVHLWANRSSFEEPPDQGNEVSA